MAQPEFRRYDAGERRRLSPNRPGAVAVPLNAGRRATLPYTGLSVPAKRLCPLRFGDALATLGVSDAFVVPVEGGWQPFIELSDARERWALERRNSIEEAEAVSRHFLGTLADAVTHAAQGTFSLGDVEHDATVLECPRAFRRPRPLTQRLPAVLAEAQAARESSGWELVYSRQRALR